MAAISRFTYKSLRRAEQHSFNHRVMEIIERTMGDGSSQYQAFKKHAVALGGFLTNKALMESTSLAELDAQTDRAWASMYHQLQSSIRHNDQFVRFSAEMLWAIFNKTENPTALNYDEEYGALRILISQLDRVDRDDFRRAKAEDCYEFLRSSVEEFIAARENVTDIKAARVTGEGKEAVEGCAKSWVLLAKYIEVMAEGGDAQAALAVSQLNVITSAIKQRLSHRKSNENAEDDGNIVDEIVDTQN